MIKSTRCAVASGLALLLFLLPRATEADDQIRAAQRVLEPRAQLPQEFVSRGVAEGVVDLLEAVEVDEHEREAASLRVRVPVLGRDSVGTHSGRRAGFRARE